MRSRGEQAPTSTQRSKGSGIREKSKKGEAATSPGDRRTHTDSIENAREGKSSAREGLSKEERQRLREKRQEQWNSKSGSQRGRERSQPNLAARMDLLLEKIKQG